MCERWCILNKAYGLRRVCSGSAFLNLGFNFIIKSHIVGKYFSNYSLRVAAIWIPISSVDQAIVVGNLQVW